MGVLYARVAGAWVPISGGSSGTDEVSIGTSDPIGTNSAAELWYDTDDEPAAADNANYWNSGWGVVARVETATGNSSVGTGGIVLLTATFTPVVGRRYLVHGFIPRMIKDGTAGVVNIGIVEGATLEQSREGLAAFAEGVASIDWMLDSVAATARTIQLQVWTTATTVDVSLATDRRAYLTVEDIGPVTRAAVNPPAGQPTMVTAGNALGVVAVGTMKGQSPTTIAASTYVTITNPLSVFLAIGRRYKISYAVRALGTTTLPAGYNYRLSLNAGVPFGERLAWCGGNWETKSDNWIVDGDNANHTLNVEMFATSGMVVYTDSNWHFYVEDVGPNQAPALPIPETPPGWTPLTLINGWLDADNSGNVYYDVPACRKIGDVVTLRGLIYRNTDPVPAASYPCFKVPAQFRPRKWITQTVESYGLAGVVEINISPDDGSVYFDNMAQAGTWARPYISFGHLSWATS